MNQKKIIAQDDTDKPAKKKRKKPKKKKSCKGNRPRENPEEDLTEENCPDTGSPTMKW